MCLAGGRLLEGLRPSQPQGSGSAARLVQAGARRWWMGVSRGPPGTQLPAPLPHRGCPLLSGLLARGPSGVSLELGRGAGGEEGAGGGEQRGPEFMLIRAEPASRLPSAAPAASSAGHSAGRSRCEAPGGRASELRGPRPVAGPGRTSGGAARRAGGHLAGPPRGTRWKPGGRDGPPPPACLAVRHGSAALGGAGQGYPAPRAARAAQRLPLQPLYDGMAPAAPPGAAQVSAGSAGTGGREAGGTGP